MRMASGNFFTWLRRRGRATRGEPRSHGRRTDDGRARRARRGARAQASKRRRPGGTDSGGAQTHAARHEQRRCAGTHTRTHTERHEQRWRTDAHRAARTAAVHRRTWTAVVHWHTPGPGDRQRWRTGAHRVARTVPWAPGTHQGGTHSGGAHVHGRQLTSRAVVPYAAGCPALCREQVAVTQAALVTVVVRDAVGRAPLALAAAGAHRRQRQKHLAPVAIFGRLGNSQGDSPDPDTVSGHSGAGMPIPGGISHRGRRLRWAERTQNGPCQGLSRRSGVISVPERVFSCFGQPKWARNGP